MIKIEIIVKELPRDVAERVKGMIEAKLTNEKATKEEISVSARIMYSLREIGNEIAREKGSRVGIWEKHVRPEQSKGDRRTDEDRQQE